MSKQNGESFLNRLLRVPFLLSAIRITCFVILIVMVYFSYNYHGINGVPSADPLMYTNLATFLFWVLWMMAVVLSVLFFGRMWCTICPLGWLNGILSMNFFKKDYPKFLKNNFLLIIFTFLVLFGSVHYKVHRFPDLTAKLILIFIAVVLLLGVVFKKRVFCRYLCPIGGMLGLYSKIGPVELFVKDRAVCEKCAGKQCINGEEKWYKLSLKKMVFMYAKQKDGCPVELIPNDLADKSACDLCMNCFEVCPHKNLNLRYRANLNDLKVTTPNVGHAIFAVVLMGLISFNLFKVFPKLKNALLGPAEYMLTYVLNVSGPAAELLAAIYSSVLLPLGFVTVISFITLILARAKVTGIGDDLGDELRAVKKIGATPNKVSFASVFTAVSYALIPIMLSAHVILSVVKLNTKLGYFEYIFSDPTGVKSYLSINVFKTLAQPGIIMPLGQLKWLLTAIIIAGLVLSVFAAKKITDSVTKSGERIGNGGLAVIIAAIATLAALYGSTVYNWLFIMGR